MELLTHIIGVLSVVVPVLCQTSSELNTASNAIWNNDGNRMPTALCQYDTYGATLFTSVDDAWMSGRPTYSAFRTLVSAYNYNLGYSETKPRAQIDSFLDAVINTGPMTKLVEYTSQWGTNPAINNQDDLRSVLDAIWFDLYTREATHDSSGFEHVFVGEIRAQGTGAVTGYHNWIQTYDEETAGNFNKNSGLGNCSPAISKFSFYWYGAYKSTSSMFIRTSPELEMALYTLCWVTRRNGNCNINLGGSSVTLVTYDYSSGMLVGSAYPNC